MPHKITDPHIAIMDFQKGGESGFSYFFNLLWPRLLRYAKDQLDDIIDGDDEAKDVVNNCFISAWKIRSEFTGMGHLKAYLYKSVKFGCYSIYKTKNTLSLKKSELKYYMEGDCEEGADMKLIKSEVIGDLYNKINKLPPERKKIFTLIYKDGLTPDDVANKLSLAITTVYEQHTKGVEMLKRLFYGSTINNLKRKLTPLQVAEIRSSPEKNIRLAERYGVSDVLISKIKKGKSHKSGWDNF